MASDEDLAAGRVVDLSDRGLDAVPDGLDTLQQSQRAGDSATSPSSRDGEVARLLLDRNRLTSLHGQALPTTLLSLSIRDNAITQISQEDLQELGDLLSLNLTGNRLRDLPAHVFHMQPALRQLYLGDNLLASVSTGLEGLRRLRVLALPGNNLTSLAGLSHCNMLTELHVSNNRLTSLSDLEALQQLTTLFAGDNEIASVALTRPLPRLRRIVLYNNRLTSLDGFSVFPALTEAILDDNELSQFAGWAEQVPTLQRLSVRNNSLGDAGDANAELALPELRELNVSGNELTRLGVLAPCRRLSTLYMAHNKVRSLDTAVPLDVLRTLVLANNEITVVTADALKSLRSLTHVNLANNNLSDLVAFGQAAAALHTVEQLDLRGNPMLDDVYPDVVVHNALPVHEVYHDSLAAYEHAMQQTAESPTRAHRLYYRCFLVYQWLPTLVLLDHIAVTLGEKRVAVDLTTKVAVRVEAGGSLHDAPPGTYSLGVTPRSPPTSVATQTTSASVAPAADAELPFPPLPQAWSPFLQPLLATRRLRAADKSATDSRILLMSPKAPRVDLAATAPLDAAIEQAEVHASGGAGVSRQRPVTQHHGTVMSPVKYDDELVRQTESEDVQVGHVPRAREFLVDLLHSGGPGGSVDSHGSRSRSSRRSSVASLVAAHEGIVASRQSSGVLPEVHAEDAGDEVYQPFDDEVDEQLSAYARSTLELEPATLAALRSAHASAEAEAADSKQGKKRKKKGKGKGKGQPAGAADSNVPGADIDDDLSVYARSTITSEQARALTRATITSDPVPGAFSRDTVAYSAPVVADDAPAAAYVHGGDDATDAQRAASPPPPPPPAPDALAEQQHGGRLLRGDDDDDDDDGDGDGDGDEAAAAAAAAPRRRVQASASDPTLLRAVAARHRAQRVGSPDVLLQQQHRRRSGKVVSRRTAAVGPDQARGGLRDIATGPDTGRQLRDTSTGTDDADRPQAQQDGDSFSRDVDDLVGRYQQRYESFLDDFRRRALRDIDDAARAASSHGPDVSFHEHLDDGSSDDDKKDNADGSRRRRGTAPGDRVNSQRAEAEAVAAMRDARARVAAAAAAHPNPPVSSSASAEPRPHSHSHCRVRGHSHSDEYYRGDGGDEDDGFDGDTGAFLAASRRARAARDLEALLADSAQHQAARMRDVGMLGGVERGLGLFDDYDPLRYTLRRYYQQVALSAAERDRTRFRMHYDEPLPAPLHPGDLGGAADVPAQQQRLDSVRADLPPQLQRAARRYIDPQPQPPLRSVVRGDPRAVEPADALPPRAVAAAAATAAPSRSAAAAAASPPPPRRRRSSTAAAVVDDEGADELRQAWTVPMPSGADPELLEAEMQHRQAQKLKLRRQPLPMTDSQEAAVRQPPLPPRTAGDASVQTEQGDVNASVASMVSHTTQTARNAASQTQAPPSPPQPRKATAFWVGVDGGDDRNESQSPQFPRFGRPPISARDPPARVYHRQHTSAPRRGGDVSTAKHSTRSGGAWQPDPRDAWTASLRSVSGGRGGGTTRTAARSRPGKGQPLDKRVRSTWERSLRNPHFADAPQQQHKHHRQHASTAAVDEPLCPRCFSHAGGPVCPHLLRAYSARPPTRPPAAAAVDVSIPRPRRTAARKGRKLRSKPVSGERVFHELPRVQPAPEPPQPVRAFDLGESTSRPAVSADMLDEVRQALLATRRRLTTDAVRDARSSVPGVLGVPQQQRRRRVALPGDWDSELGDDGDNDAPGYDDGHGHGGDGDAGAGADPADVSSSSQLERGPLDATGSTAVTARTDALDASLRAAANDALAQAAISLPPQHAQPGRASSPVLVDLPESSDEFALVAALIDAQNASGARAHVRFSSYTCRRVLKIHHASQLARLDTCLYGGLPELLFHGAPPRTLTNLLHDSFAGYAAQPERLVFATTLSVADSAMTADPDYQPMPATRTWRVLITAAALGHTYSFKNTLEYFAARPQHRHDLMRAGYHSVAFPRSDRLVVLHPERAVPVYLVEYSVVS